MATCCGKMSSGNFILTKAPLVMGFGTGVSCILPWGGSHHCPLWAATGNQRCHTVQGSAIWETASKDNSGPGSWARPSHPVSVFTSLRQEKPSSFHVPRSWRQMGFRVPKALGNSEPVTISLDGVSHRSSCRSHFRASDNIRVRMFVSSRLQFQDFNCSRAFIICHLCALIKLFKCFHFFL